MSTLEPMKNKMIARKSPQGGAHLPQLAILTLFVVMGVVVGRTALGSRLGGDQSGVSPSSVTIKVPDHSQGSRTHDRVAVEVANAPSVAPLDTLAALEGHWGADWPQVKTEIFGEDFEQEVQSVVMPWEQSSEMHLSGYLLDTGHQELLYRRLMKWPGREFSTHVLIVDAGYSELNAQNLANCTGTAALRDMPNSVIQQFDLDLNDVNDHLDSRIREFMDLLDRAIEVEFNSGGLAKAPLRLGSSKPSLGAVFGRTVRGNGWQSRLEITGERYPYLADLHKEISSLRDARKVRLKGLVASQISES